MKICIDSKKELDDAIEGCNTLIKTYSNDDFGFNSKVTLLIMKKKNDDALECCDAWAK